MLVNFYLYHTDESLEFKPRSHHVRALHLCHLDELLKFELRSPTLHAGELPLETQEFEPWFPGLYASAVPGVPP